MQARERVSIAIPLLPVSTKCVFHYVRSDGARRLAGMISLEEVEQYLDLVPHIFQQQGGLQDEVGCGRAQLDGDSWHSTLIFILG